MTVKLWLLEAHKTYTVGPSHRPRVPPPVFICSNCPFTHTHTAHVHILYIVITTHTQTHTRREQRRTLSPFGNVSGSDSAVLFTPHCWGGGGCVVFVALKHRLVDIVQVKGVNTSYANRCLL